LTLLIMQRGPCRTEPVIARTIRSRAGLLRLERRPDSDQIQTEARPVDGSSP
jgi:hypothetical protein